VREGQGTGAWDTVQEGQRAGAGQSTRTPEETGRGGGRQTHGMSVTSVPYTPMGRTSSSRRDLEEYWLLLSGRGGVSSVQPGRSRCGRWR